MPICDFNQVKDFATTVNAQLDRCENGEGADCSSIDATLTFCAQQCCTFVDAVRKWAQDVFAGRIAFDPAVEQLWKAELVQLFSRAQHLLSLGWQTDPSWYALEGKTRLESALWNLQKLLNEWVSPKLSVGPSARMKLPADAIDRQRIESLPPLSADKR